jgi:thioredoxin reductase
LPAVTGATDYYGRGVYHCPYCDGWEHRDRPLVAYGAGDAVAGLALSLLTWSKDVTVCTGGTPVPDDDRQRLEANGIRIRTEPILRLQGSSDGMLQRVVFHDGEPLACEALFFSTDHVQRSPLPAALGCDLDEKGHVRTRESQHTGIEGLYLAGDADGHVQFVIVAAAEGAIAAVAINRELQQEDLA